MEYYKKPLCQHLLDCDSAGPAISFSEQNGWQVALQWPCPSSRLSVGENSLKVSHKQNGVHCLLVEVVRKCILSSQLSVLIVLVEMQIKSTLMAILEIGKMAEVIVSVAKTHHKFVVLSNI